MNWQSQHGYDVRMEWGAHGLGHLASDCDAIVIVDVLSFTTCVDVACSNGAHLYPYRHRDSGAGHFAESIGGIAAGERDSLPGSYSLSPASLLQIPAGLKLVLPSPNGSALSLAAATDPARHVIAACLRNASAVGEWLGKHCRRVAVIACGERWEDGSLRPAMEDLVGAGAVISALNGTKSPEALAAGHVFNSLRPELPDIIGNCLSGRELAVRGFEDDVRIAAALDVSTGVPRLSTSGYYHT